MIEDGERRPGVFYKDGKIVRWECQDCKNRDITYFMVRQELWDEVGLTGIICPECFEKRIGRTLTINDFSNALSNNELRYGYALAERDLRVGLLHHLAYASYGDRIDHTAEINKFFDKVEQWISQNKTHS